VERIARGVAWLGLVPVLAGVAATVGLGVVRGLPSWSVALAAAAIGALPIGGLWLLLGRGPWSLACAAWSWPAMLFVGLPAFFPGEVPGALGTGLAVFAAPLGKGAAAQASALGARLPVASEGKAPPPTAGLATEPCPPAPAAMSDDAAALPYEGSGHSLVVPVQLGPAEFPMLFDTGASLTTLSEISLRKLGLAIPRDAPTVTLHTANGERSAKIVLLDQAWVGGLPVEGVTIAACEECADLNSAGLLGLNVSGQFLVTVDTARKEVVFQARQGAADRIIDVAAWLNVNATARIFPDTRVEVEVRGTNESGRAVTEAEVGLHCGEDHFRAILRDVPAHGTATTSVSLPRGTRCDAYRVTLDHARW
jgi:predicted aspartyl protease